MLRTGQLHTPKGVVAPLRRRPLDRRREPRYRGPWRLPGPDSHRLAALNLTPGYIRTSFPARMPGLLDVRRFIWQVVVDLFGRYWASRPRGNTSSGGPRLNGTPSYT